MSQQIFSARANSGMEIWRGFYCIHIPNAQYFLTFWISQLFCLALYMSIFNFNHNAVWRRNIDESNESKTAQRIERRYYGPNGYFAQHKCMTMNLPTTIGSCQTVLCWPWIRGRSKKRLYTKNMRLRLQFFILRQKKKRLDSIRWNIFLYSYRTTIVTQNKIGKEWKKCDAMWPRWQYTIVCACRWPYRAMNDMDAQNDDKWRLHRQSQVYEPSLHQRLNKRTYVCSISTHFSISPTKYYRWRIRHMISNCLEMLTVLLCLGAFAQRMIMPYLHIEPN